MGNPDTITDGQWKFVYTISDGANTYTKQSINYSIVIQNVV